MDEPIQLIEKALGTEYFESHRSSIDYILAKAESREEANPGNELVEETLRTLASSVDPGIMVIVYLGSAGYARETGMHFDDLYRKIMG